MGRAGKVGALLFVGAMIGVAAAAASCGGSDFSGVTPSEAGADGTTDGGAPGDGSGGDGANPPGCPATQPSGHCSGEKVQCTYGCTSCGCVQGNWQCAAPGCAGGCLPNTPVAGTACGGCCGPSVGMSCDYPCNGGAGTLKATCVGSGGLNGTWTVEQCRSDAGGSDPGLVSCGGAKCDLDAGQGCCDTIANDAGKQSCGPLGSGSFCMTGAIEQCDEKADCTGGDVCCIQFLPQGVQATCMPSCATGAVRYQACKTNGECQGGGPCATHTCVAGETVRTCEKPLGCQ